MKRLAVIIIAAAGFFPAAAVAAPVPIPTARRAVLKWWKDSKPPRIAWCAVKRYGTICQLKTGLDNSGPLSASINGYGTDMVWISRTHGGPVRVADLGWFISVTINGG